MSNYLVVVTDDRFGSYSEEKEVLGELDVELKIFNCATEDEVIDAVRGADGVLVNLAPVTENVIRAMDRCKVISRYGVGYDNVNIDVATERGIWVARVPDYSFEDVSDHALALLMGAVRKITYKDRRIREGGWNIRKEQPIHRIKGRVLGLVGYGAIARTLHRKVSGLGLKGVLVYDPFVEEEEIAKQGAEKVSFERLLKDSDFISIHVPLTDETFHMFGKSEFKLMKGEAIVINTSRGPVIDEKALIEALEGGKIGYACLDVFETEPLPDNHPLKRLNNVILTDHTGYYSEESLVELKTKAAKNILEVLKGNKPIYPVNDV